MKDLNSKQCGCCRLAKPLDNFVTIYGYRNPKGKYCKACFLVRQQEHAKELLEGSDFCLYCGKRISKVYDWKPNGSSLRTYVNLDHMDPIALGGSDSNRNTLYCCPECNSRKGDRPFTDWLKQIKPQFQKLAREVYTRKHRRPPEKFRPKVREFIWSLDLSKILANK